jgi:peptide/nickel transport system permease protein
MAYVAQRRIRASDRHARGRRANASLRAGLTLLGLILTLGCLSFVTLPDPNRQNLGAILLAPGSKGHLLGTDALGRDVLAWISSSIWTSLAVAGAFVVLSATVGVTVGLLAVYFGGLVDAVLMRITDLQLAVPALLVFISASVVLRPNPAALVVLLATFGWVPYARLVRSVGLVERERAFVAAARLAGAPRRRLIGVYLLRPVSTTVFVLSSLQLGWGVLSESALSFVGLGITPPTTSLGYLLNAGRATVADGWWVVVFPGVAVALLVLMANLIGDGLRDALHQDMEAQ